MEELRGLCETFSIYLTVVIWACCNPSVIDFSALAAFLCSRKHSCLSFPAGTWGLRSSQSMEWGIAGFECYRKLVCRGEAQSNQLEHSSRRKPKSDPSDGVGVHPHTPLLWTVWEEGLVPRVPKPKGKWFPAAHDTGLFTLAWSGEAGRELFFLQNPYITKQCAQLIMKLKGDHSGCA